MPTSANPNLLVVDWSKIPPPIDDGGAGHLQGAKVTDIALPATDGSHVSLARLAGRVVVFAYPRTGEPGKPALVQDWDMIPGARGCTPQSCAFRDLHKVLIEAGAAHVVGLSTRHRLPARGRPAPAPAVSVALGRKAGAGSGAEAADYAGGRAYPPQAPGARHRRRQHCEGVLSRLPSGQERGRGA